MTVAVAGPSSAPSPPIASTSTSTSTSLPASTSTSSKLNPNSQAFSFLQSEPSTRLSDRPSSIPPPVTVASFSPQQHQHDDVGAYVQPSLSHSHSHPTPHSVVPSTSSASSPSPSAPTAYLNHPHATMPYPPPPPPPIESYNGGWHAGPSNAPPPPPTSSHRTTGKPPWIPPPPPPAHHQQYHQQHHYQPQPPPPPPPPPPSGPNYYPYPPPYYAAPRHQQQAHPHQHSPFHHQHHHPHPHYGPGSTGGVYLPLAANDTPLAPPPHPQQLLPPWEQQQHRPPQQPPPPIPTVTVAVAVAAQLLSSPEPSPASPSPSHPPSPPQHQHHQFNNMSPILAPPRSSFLIRPDSSISQRLAAAAAATGMRGTRRRSNRPPPSEAPGFAVGPNVDMPQEWRVQYGIVHSSKDKQDAFTPSASSTPATTRTSNAEEKAPPSVVAATRTPSDAPIRPSTPKASAWASTTSTPAWLSTPARDYLLTNVSTTATAASSLHSSPILTPASPTTTTTTLDDSHEGNGVNGGSATTTTTAAAGTPPTMETQPSTPKSPTTTTAPKKSWADLLRSPGSSVAPSALANGHPTTPIIEHIPKSTFGVDGATKRKTLAETLAGVKYHFDQPMSIVPRGLINNGNLCFANAILQVLVYCAPFVNLLALIKKETRLDLSGKTPSMDAMIHFLEEFRSSSKTTVVSRHRNAKNASLPGSPLTSGGSPYDTFIPLSEYADPFVPEGVYESLKPNKRFDAMRRGHQEDAEEFLGFFLDTLHEEILATVDRVDGVVSTEEAKGDVGGNEAEDEWTEVGSKGRMATTRTTETRESPITRIFGGQLRSVLRCPGQKDSITLEPYQRLQLDIEPDHVRTIEDALLNLTLPEPLPDFVARSGIRVEATKQVHLESFPPVLILHLKRFVFDNVGGVQKSGKVIGYGTELEIGEKIVGPTKRTGKTVRYQLFGVVYHHGNYASGGHYTVAVRQQLHSNASWLHIDDTSIRPIMPSEVAVGRDGAPGSNHHDGEKRAYLLMYNRVA